MKAVLSRMAERVCRSSAEATRFSRPPSNQRKKGARLPSKTLSKGFAHSIERASRAQNASGSLCAASRSRR